MEDDFSMVNAKSIIERLRKSLGYADNVIDEMWQEMMNRTVDLVGTPRQKRHGAELEEALSDRLMLLGKEFPIALEMLRLPETRKDFITQWAEFDDEALRSTEERHDDEGDEVVSAPLRLCWRIMRMIESGYEKETAEIQEGALEILDFILESTARIVERSCPHPTCEREICVPMHAHLQATFHGFTPSVVISKPGIGFRPDCGIIDFRAAIEFKYVDSVEELRVALHGLTEDLSGYADSLDWTRYYTAIYQTGAYGTQTQVRENLRKSGNADRWTVHLVTGKGSRSKKRS